MPLARTGKSLSLVLLASALLACGGGGSGGSAASSSSSSISSAASSAASSASSQTSSVSSSSSSVAASSSSSVASSSSSAAANAVSGWAAVGAASGNTGSGVTGGGSYTCTTTVTTRAALMTALNNDTAKVVCVSGTIDFTVNSSGTAYTEVLYATEAGYSSYTTAKYIADQTTWESARAAGYAKQKAWVTVPVGSNTTLVGVGTSAAIKGAMLQISKKNNIIIRNIAFETPKDWFPAWDVSEWNAQFDTIQIKGGDDNGATAYNIWIDHCTFDDGQFLEDWSYQPLGGKHVTYHDGVIDVSNGADFVTLSYNHIRNHDKTHIIGSSDSSTADDGNLRVSFIGNYYENAVQRLPRVRYGRVHALNNYFSGNKSSTNYAFSYAFGVGTSSKIYSEANYFEVTGATVSNLLSTGMSGTTFYDTGSYLNGSSVDINSAYSYSSDVGWTPSSFYSYAPLTAAAAKDKALSYAGAGKITLVAASGASR